MEDYTKELEEAKRELKRTLFSCIKAMLTTLAICSGIYWFVTKL